MDAAETVLRMSLIVHSIWFMVAESAGYTIALDDYDVGFYVRHPATGSDVYREQLSVRAGVDPKTSRPDFRITAFDDPPEEGEDPA